MYRFHQEKRIAGTIGHFLLWDAMYRFHQEKRIKPGLAITQRHIRLCDGHLRAAGVSSRNEFVEKAIECYAGWLDVKQNPEFFRELFGPDIGR